jgi:hypothetical protein
MIWELDATGGKLTGVQKQGDRSTPLTGVRAPELNAQHAGAMDDTRGALQWQEP